MEAIRFIAALFILAAYSTFIGAFLTIGEYIAMVMIGHFCPEVEEEEETTPAEDKPKLHGW
jgi:hypothetical protein